jgi:subtilase family serine protease
LSLYAIAVPSHAQTNIANAIPTGSSLVGRAPAGAAMSVSVVLPLRNQSELTAFLSRLYAPSDPIYGQYLTPEEFNTRFAPSQADVDAVSAFASEHGLTVASVSDNHTVVKLSGTASSIENAFSVHIYNLTTSDGRLVHTADSKPTIPAAIASRVVGLIGLDNLAKPRALGRRAPAAATVGLSESPSDLWVSGPAGGLAPSDVRRIYNATVTNATGSGIKVGLFEMDGWTPSDITAFEKQFGLPKTAPTLVSVDGGDGTVEDPDGAAETTLDIDMIMTMAPGVKGIYVYQTPEASTYSSYLQNCVDIFNAIAGQDKVNVASASYGISELDLTGSTVTEKDQAVNFFTAENQALEQMAAQGQTMLAAAGDAGAYTDSIDFPDIPSTSDPASEPYVLAVGGTDLTDSSTLAYISETSWADPFDIGRGPDGTGGGGGVSSIWSLPSYQASAFSPSVNPQGSTTMRNVPDVSLYGDYDTGGYSIDLTYPGYGSDWGAYNGTSASSPLWAGFLAGVDSKRKSAGLPQLGFVNPLIYQLGESASYSTLFHDVDDGSNNLFYNAVAGYDNSTGWGSFQGDNLAAALLNGATSSATPISISATPDPVDANKAVTFKVTLSGPAPTGGTVVPITLNGSTVGTVTIPSGKIAGTLKIYAPAAGTYSYSDGVQSVTVTVVSSIYPTSIQIDPGATKAKGRVLAVIRLSAPALIGGYTVPVKVGGVLVDVVKFPAGITEGSIVFDAPAANGVYTVVAGGAGSTATASLTVFTPPTVASLAFNPNPVDTNSETTMTVTLSGPSAQTVARVQVDYTEDGQTFEFAYLDIPQGQTTATCSVYTYDAVGKYQFTARYMGSSASATLKIVSP